jgi:hypothetical protein
MIINIEQVVFISFVHLKIKQVTNNMNIRKTTFCVNMLIIFNYIIISLALFENDGYFLLLLLLNVYRKFIIIGYE